MKSSRRYRAGILVLLWITAAFRGGETLGSPAPPSLRVMTFNIRYDTEADGKNAWSHRKDMAASVVRFHEADLVGLQETLRGQIHDLEDRLPGFAWFGVGRDDGKKAGEFCAVFYRESRLRLLDHGTFWLSESPETPGKTGWDAACPRIVTWGKLRDLATGKEFLLFNTHLDHRGAVARKNAALLIRERAKSIAGRTPAILLGDFNCNEDSEPYRVLIGAELPGDAFSFTDTLGLTRVPHHGPIATYHGFSGVVDTARGAIDHVFVRGDIEVRRHGTLSESVDGRYPSDHLPVLVEIVIR